MIVAKTKMKRMPETCKKCAKMVPIKNGPGRCGYTGMPCPTEKKGSGNIGYTMPEWCPLMDIDLLEVEEDG